MKSAIILLSFVAVAIATVSTTGPFSGSSFENFESYSSGSHTSVSIFGGQGSIVDSSGYVARTNGWGLATSSCSGQPHDGDYFFGHNTGLQSITTFNFPSGVTQFGGYFGYAVSSTPATFKFYSASGLEGTLTFQYDPTAQLCRPIWFGASSTVPIKRIEMTSYYGVFDSITASLSPVSVCGNGIVETGEQCDSSSTCCSSCQYSASTTVCRSSAGDCDVAETCSGTSDSCPVDSFSSSSVVCRPSAGVCDVADTCSGNAASCPSDSVQTSSFVCRPAVDGCDLADTCDGTSTSCSADLKSNSAACFCSTRTR